METIEDFVQRISKALSCHNHLTQSGNLYSLKKFNSNRRRRMGVFGWVKELKRKGLFEISTYKHLGDKARVSDLADKVKEGMHYVSKKKDTEGKGTGLIFYVKKDSDRDDYKKTTKAFREIIELVGIKNKGAAP